MYLEFKNYTMLANNVERKKYNIVNNSLSAKFT